MRVEKGAGSFIDLGGRSRLDKVETEKRRVDEQEATRVETRKVEQKVEAAAAATGRLLDRTV